MDQTINQELFAASASGDLKTVQEAIAKGADVNCMFNDGRTPLMRASKRGHDEMLSEHWTRRTP